MGGADRNTVGMSVYVRNQHLARTQLVSEGAYSPEFCTWSLRARTTNYTG